MLKIIFNSNFTYLRVFFLLQKLLLRTDFCFIFMALRSGTSTDVFNKGMQ